MVMRLTGIVHGRRIDLDRDTGLSDGETVEVHIVHSTPSVDDLKKKADALCGAWAGDERLDSAFAENERARSSASALD